MARRYTLDTKIHALNSLDKHDGDLLYVSDELKIPTSTLAGWRTQEDDLRADYRQKLKRQFDRLKAELQVNMLDRGMQIVACMDDETLKNAPLNQLATALGALVNHALKLEEAIEDNNEQEEQVVRFEFVSDGRVTQTPPWTMESSESSSPIQDRSMWKTLGKNGTGQDHHNGRGKVLRSADLVADSDLSDVESGLAGLEDDRQDYDWYHD